VFVLLLTVMCTRAYWLLMQRVLSLLFKIKLINLKKKKKKKKKKTSSLSINLEKKSNILAHVVEQTLLIGEF
jgi:hypothetical protein